jgi:hypothetical protein
LLSYSTLGWNDLATVHCLFFFVSVTRVSDYYVFWETLDDEDHDFAWEAARSIVRRSTRECLRITIPVWNVLRNHSTNAQNL